MSQDSSSYADIIKEQFEQLQTDTILQKELRDEALNLNKKIIEFKKFYNTEDDYKTRIPYPYREDNQPRYDELAGDISSAFEQVENVIDELTKKKFELERNQQSNDNFSMQTHESLPQPEIVVEGQKQPNALQKMFGAKKKKIVNKNDPYQIFLRYFVIPTYKMMDKWDIHKNWQSVNLTWDESQMDRFGYNQCLVRHKALFSDEVETKIIKIYWQGLNLQRLLEKNISGAVLMRSLQELRQQEQQMQNR